jgi:seryl-tRNA synthetase
MTTIPRQIDMNQLRQNIRATVANLQALGEVGDAKEQLAEVQRELKTVQHNLAGMRNELKEVTDQYNARAKATHEEHAKGERLRAENKKLSEEHSSITTALNKIRQQLGG